MIKVRPINAGDTRLSHGEIRNMVGSGRNDIYNSSNVESTKIFGTTVKDGYTDRRYEDPYIRMGHIKLAIPILNPFLAGAAGETWSKVIPKSLESNIADVVCGNKFYSVRDGKSVHVSDMSGSYSEKDWLIGGQYLRWLIDQVDVEKEIREEVYEKYVYPTLSPKRDGGMSEKDLWKCNRQMVGTITKDVGDCWVIDRYYFTAARASYDYGRLKDHIEEVDEVEMNKHMSRLLLLFSLRENLRSFRDQVQDVVFVLPTGYRRRVDNMLDPMTKQYNLLVKVNNDLRELISYSNVDIKTVQAKYKELYNRVVNIFVGADNMYNSESYKPLREMLAHKTGLIRGNMMASRIDYSGRTVIVQNPQMPLDYIGLPVKIIEKLCELNVIENWQLHDQEENKAYMMTHKFDKRRLTMAAKYMDGRYVGIGRQPTLLRLGIQAFKVIPIYGNAIVLSPLVVTPFNADFDGDQMHVFGIIGSMAYNEVVNLLASTKNLFHPKNGEITPVPRHEILYGLYIATVITEGRNSVRTWTESALTKLESEFQRSGKMSIYELVYEAVCTQKINVYDLVNGSNIHGGKMRAGLIAIKYALGKGYYDNVIGAVPVQKYSEKKKEDGVCTSSWCKAVLQQLAEMGNSTRFVDTVNKLVRLGYSLAEIYPPTMSLIDLPDVSDIMSDFEHKVAEREELFNCGFETEESYSIFYGKAYSDLESAIKSRVKSSLPGDSGWLRMVKSGAKGSDSNLVQMFGMKGRVAKDKVRAFPVALEHCLGQGVPMLEHMITSYGSRQGIVDKVVATNEPGYLSLLIKHTTCGICITMEDCGTDNGLELTYDDIKRFIPQWQLHGDDEAFNNGAVREYFSKILVGRYVQPGSVYIEDLQQANEFYDAYVASVDPDTGEFVKYNGIKMRSPVTCSCPCCAKCYGKDLDTGMVQPVVGTPIGFNTAGAVGEPCTQLTMNNFHKGGVASSGGLGSAFGKVHDYMHLYTFRKGSTDEPINYDFTSPVRGVVEEIYISNGLKEIRIFDPEDKDRQYNLLKSKLVMYADVAVKPFVEVGDSLCVIPDDLDIREVLKIRGVEEAQKYLVLQLYDTFNNEVDISMKHFEVIVCGLTYWVCLCGDGKNYKTGEYYTAIDLYWNPPEGDMPFMKTMKGLKDVPKFKHDFLASMFMEDIGRCAQRSINVSPTDSMKSPIVRLAFGMDIGMGSCYEDYIQERGNV